MWALSILYSTCFLFYLLFYLLKLNYYLYTDDPQSYSSNLSPLQTPELRSHQDISLDDNKHLKLGMHVFSVSQSCPTLFNPMDFSMPGFPVLHYLLEFAQTQVHWEGDAIQPSHPLSSPSLVLSLSCHQGLFQWVGCSHQEAKVLELQLQHQSVQWIFQWKSEMNNLDEQIWLCEGHW